MPYNNGRDGRCRKKVREKRRKRGAWEEEKD
jgi:hypothetical protein